jgi:hypothetical protein
MRALLALALLLTACAQRSPSPATPSGNVSMGGEPIQLATLTPAEVAAKVQVTDRAKDVVVRAPTLSVTNTTDLRGSVPGVGVNIGRVTLGRFGFLFGVKSKHDATVRSFAVFQSDFVEGKNRFAKARLGDGTNIPFKVAASNRGQCKEDCYLVFESIVLDLPDAALRHVTDDGLKLVLTLDNGYEIPVQVPAAYVRGYLQALDAAT